MKTYLLGFRVTAKQGGVFRTDNFELRQAAIECAKRSAAAGLRYVRASIVTREGLEFGDWIDDEVLDVIWPESEKE